MDIYSTHELRPMVRIAQPNSQFLLNAFFPDTVLFDDEYITFDIKKSKRKLAPFVSPCTQGKPNTQQGTTTKSFKPPYVKPKDMVKPCKSVRRAAGEAIGGELTQSERNDIALAEVLADHATQIDTRMEWQAAKVLSDGKFTVSGEDVPEQEIDYGRNAEHDRNAVADGYDWGDVTTDIAEELEDEAGRILSAVGAGVTDMVMDPKAWQLFRKNDSVKELLEIRNGGLTDLNIAPEVGAKSYYKGMYGNINVWVYADTYEEEDSDQLIEFLDDYTVILVANGERGLDGYRAFGAIQDLDSLEPAEIFTKMKPEFDPSGMCVLSQSAGIVIPSRIDATVKIDVTPDA